MVDQRKRSGEPVALVIGVLLSSGLGAFFYFRTDIKAALATFAALVGTTIALQVESLLRERRISEELTRQQRLMSKIEAIDWFPRQLEMMLNSIKAIEEGYHATMAVDLARKAFEECFAQMRNLQRGHFEVPFDDNWLIYALTERARNNLLATSVEEVDLSWWQSAAGETYWRLHKEALRRGVGIQRIFIYQEWTDTHEELARRQCNAGVNVMRVQNHRLPPTLRLDMIIWDGQCGFESRVNSTGQEAITNNYTFAEQDLNVMIDRYKMIESCAEAWVPVESAESE